MKTCSTCKHCLPTSDKDKKQCGIDNVLIYRPNADSCKMWEGE